MNKKEYMDIYYFERNSYIVKKTKCKIFKDSEKTILGQKINYDFYFTDELKAWEALLNECQDNVISFFYSIKEQEFKINDTKIELEKELNNVCETQKNFFKFLSDKDIK